METKLIDYAMNDDAKSFRDQLYAEIQAKVLNKFEEKCQEVARNLIAQEAKMNPMDPKEHSDEAEDKALVKKMVKKDCLTKEEIESLEEKKWIAGAIKHPGALHKELGVPEGEKIPQSKLKAAAHAGGKEGKRARLAMTLSKFHKEEASMEDLADALYETPEDVCDELINEVLSKDATAGDWIHDFVHSKNPKFEGKSKEMRKKMALAAYYSRKKVSEEVIEEEKASAHDNWQADWDSHRTFGRLSKKTALQRIKMEKSKGTYKPDPNNPYADEHSGHKPDPKVVAAHKKQGSYHPD